MRIRDLMTADPVTGTPGMLVVEARRLMDRHGVHHLPVVEHGAVVGMVANRDISADGDPVRSLTPQPASMPDRYRPVREVMSAPAHTVDAEAPIDVAVHLLVSRRIRALPVLDGSRLVGILTTTDILRALLANPHDWQRDARPVRPVARPVAFVVHADAQARQRHREALTVRGFAVETCPGPATFGGLCPAVQATDTPPCLRLPTDDIALVVLDPEAASAGLAETYRRWLPSAVIQISEYPVVHEEMSL